MTRSHCGADVATRPETRTEVRRLTDGRLELRHLRHGDGLGWYATQRTVLEPEAAEALCDAIRANLSSADPAAPSATASAYQGKVVYLADRR